MLRSMLQILLSLTHLIQKHIHIVVVIVFFSSLFTTRKGFNHIILNYVDMWYSRHLVSLHAFCYACENKNVYNARQSWINIILIQGGIWIREVLSGLRNWLSYLSMKHNLFFVKFPVCSIKKNCVCFLVLSQIIITHFQTYSSFFSPWWTFCYRWSCKMWATLMWLPSSGCCACSELSEHSGHCVFWELSGKGRVGSGLTRRGRVGCLCPGAESLLHNWFVL